MPSPSIHPFDALMDYVANTLAERVTAALGTSRAAVKSRSLKAAVTRAPGGLTANEKRRQAMLGRKLDMACRIPGCKKRSGGPGKGYMCQEHQELPKKQRQAAREAWKAKKKAT